MISQNVLRTCFRGTLIFKKDLKDLVFGLLELLTSHFFAVLQNPAIADIYTEHAHNVTVAKYAPSGFYIASGGNWPAYEHMSTKIVITTVILMKLMMHKILYLGTIMHWPK